MRVKAGLLPPEANKMFAVNSNFMREKLLQRNWEAKDDAEREQTRLGALGMRRLSQVEAWERLFEQDPNAMLSAMRKRGAPIPPDIMER